jgi:hypothetical protein
MLIIAAAYRDFDYGNQVEDETVTTTTTTTTTTTDNGYVPGETYDIVGTITRGWDNNQPYVNDPVDGLKVWLNEADTMYEDADGKIWELQ